MIHFERRRHVARAYEVLARIDRPGDAAQLGTRAPRADLTALHARHRAAAARLDFLPLEVDDEEELQLALEGLALQHPAAAALFHTFRAALDHTEVAETTPQRDLAAAIAPTLGELRAALWREHGAPPPLLVLDAPALGSAGRGLRRREEHRVAVSFAEPDVQVLLQTFHEEVHAISDRAVPSAPRDTRRGDRQHEALERAALDLGAEVVARAAPALVPAYRAWRARFG